MITRRQFRACCAAFAVLLDAGADVQACEFETGAVHGPVLEPNPFLPWAERFVASILEGGR